MNLIRYADDFLITGRTKELLEEEVKPLVEALWKPSSRSAGWNSLPRRPA